MSSKSASKGPSDAPPLHPFSPVQWRRILRETVSAALHEDIGTGDVSSAIFSIKEKGSARLLAKQDGVLSGSYLVDQVFQLLAPRAGIRWLKEDGDPFKAGEELATLEAPFASLLQGERVALNFVQRMSGIATLTRKFVEAMGEAPGVHLYDTRKTTPLLRPFEKQAVVHGGGRNHRYALYDMAMLKNNHIDAAGGVQQAVGRLEQKGFFKVRPRKLLCIEARDLAEALEATRVGADIVMLDNMSPETIRQVVPQVVREAENAGREAPDLEVSGGINLKNIARYARLPIQRISVGALTHSAPALDIALHFRRK